VTKETAEKWKREKKSSEFNNSAKGYSYLSDNNIEMVEFHVDDHSFLHDVANEMGYGLMGGNLSVRKPELPSKPLMIFGQDESVLNQFLLGNRQWVGPEGQRALLPKTDGLMKSAFQSRETGFGMNLSRMQLDEINESRRGKNYVDVDAAMAIHGQATKKTSKSHLLLSFLSSEQTMKGIGHIITCPSNLKIVLIVSRLCILISISPSFLTIRKGMPKSN
jgi:hypothetical protein